MYWPAGGPRVFAAPRKASRPSSEDGDREEEDLGQDDDSIIDLCGSRNGQLVAAITKTSLSIWQTYVSGGRPSMYGF
jgi:hypothetical protein